MTKAFKHIALLAILVVSGTQAHANDAAYKEGDMTIAARVGIAPGTFKRNAKLQTTVHTGAVPAGTADVSTATTLRQSQNASFGKLYRLPVTFGADFGYFLQDNLELFANIDYARACPKNLKFTGKLGNENAPTTWKTRAYTSFAVNIGARSYFYQMGDFLPFVGAKIGLRRFASCSKPETVTAHLMTGDLKGTRSSLRNCVNFTGGVQFGFDYFLHPDYALTVMSEVIGYTGKRFNKGLEVHAKPAATRAGLQTEALGRKARSSFSFPITLGLRIKL